MNSTRDMAKEVVEWAKDNENVRVVNLYASRANPHATLDALSDYDIELFVEDLQPFREGEEWLNPFGEVMVREPYDSSVWKDGGVGPMVMFKDGQRIDFNIRLRSVLEEEIKAGDVGSWNKVLLDKDGITRNMTTLENSDAEYWTKQPTQAEYEELVHHFWWNITHVAKCLFRDQLFYAKYVLDGGLHHHYLRTVLSWHVGMRHHWEVNLGAYGRWLKDYHDSETWADVEATFAGADLEENWNAMFKIAEVFGKISSEVGGRLGYVYPVDLDQNVTNHLARIRESAQASQVRSS